MDPFLHKNYVVHNNTTDAPTIAPSFGVLFPDGEVVFSCNSTPPVAVLWLINGTVTLENMFPAGVSLANDTTLRISMSYNATAYSCGVLLPGSRVNESNVAILVLAG